MSIDIVKLVDGRRGDNALRGEKLRLPALLLLLLLVVVVFFYVDVPPTG